MSTDVLGLFIFGVLTFLMGKEHNPQAFEFSLNETGDVVFATWALIGCFSFIFGWFSFGGVA